MRSVRTRARAIAVAISFSLVASAAFAGPTPRVTGPSAPAPASINDALKRITIDNFGQINDVYFRGAQPKGRDYADLAALGVKTVIDLSNDQETEADSVKAAGMKFVRIPLTTSAAPPPSAVTQFLALVNDPANQPVYVHCQGGRHRTGVMTAIYRITHDRWTSDVAFAEMVKYEFKKGIVSHDALKRFVFAFTLPVVNNE